MQHPPVRWSPLVGCGPAAAGPAAVAVGRVLGAPARAQAGPRLPLLSSSGSSSAASCTGTTAARASRPGAKRDAHCLAWHPSSEGRAYEAAGDGAAWRRDGGVSWEVMDIGRDLRYCWALAVDPADPDRWYVSASSGPRTAHAGEDGTWRALDLPGESMPYALAAIDGALLAAMADGRILHCGDQGENWEETGVRMGPVRAMAAAENECVSAGAAADRRIPQALTETHHQVDRRSQYDRPEQVGQE